MNRETTLRAGDEAVELLQSMGIEPGARDKGALR